MSETISIRIMSPIAVVWQADVTVITAENSEGVFDILPDHARFMSLISSKPVTVELVNGETKTFSFENAILFFEDNTAVIYIQEMLEKLSI